MRKSGILTKVTLGKLGIVFEIYNFFGQNLFFEPRVVFLSRNELFFWKEQHLSFHNHLNFLKTVHY